MLDGKGSVLVVDDTPENIRVLGEILEQDGYEVYIAESGPRALEILSGVQMDLILLDIMMPEMDGYEVCRRLKAIPQLMAVPVIFLTALGSPEHELRGMEAGAVDYISKPFNIELVKARVKTHVDLYKYRSRLEELVEKRTMQLAQSYQKVQTLEITRRDLLQLLYKKLWEPKSGLFALSDNLLSRVQVSSSEKKILAAEVDLAKEGLVSVINSGLFLRSPDEADAGAATAVLLGKLLEKSLESRTDFEFSRDESPLVCGNLDLIQFTITTLVEVTELLKQKPSKARVWLESKKTGGSLILEFSTNELTPEDLPGFFDPLKSPWAKTSALKLGQEIVLCSRIIQIMGGQLQCVATDARTVRFTLTLPLNEIAQEGAFIKL